MSTHDKREQFLNSYSGRSLLQKYSLGQYGTWRIRGEDANCDLGGSHYMPELGVVEGTLTDIIDYAVELPNFFQWGGGGDITMQKPPLKVDLHTVQLRREITERIDQLEDELKQAREALEQMGG